MSNDRDSRQRINAIKRSGLLQRTGGEQFGHLTEHVRVSLEVPVAIISIVDEDRQVFAGHCGLPEPWASIGETPMTHSFCQYVVETAGPLIVADARIHDLVMTNHAISDLGVIAYLGVPIHLPTGELVGALAAIDTQPRNWTKRDRLSLETLAKVVEKEIAVGVSELKYRTLFENMQEGFYTASAVRHADGTLADILFEDVNPAFERLTGTASDQVVGSTLTQRFPQTAQDMLPVYERVFQQGEPLLHTNNALVLGDDRWFENRLRRIGPDRLASIFDDVTPRKTAERRLIESEAYWRGIFEQLDEGFVLGELIRDDNGKVVDWRYKEVNRAWGELVGVPASQALGRTIREVFPGIEDEWVHEFAKVAESGKPAIFTRQVGTIGRWYEGHAQPLGPDSFVVIFLDVTERLKMETELRAREQQLRTVIESMPVGILIAEAPDGRIVIQNERLTQLLGLDATEATSVDRYDIFRMSHGDGTAVSPGDYPLTRIMKGECRTATLEGLYHRPDGREVWVSAAGEAFEDGAGHVLGAVLVVTDISDRKKADAEQQLINREMSHRLKNMLSMVQAIAAQTLKHVPDQSHVRAFEARLQALSSAHDVLVNQNRDEAPIGLLIRSTLQRLIPSERLDLDGPDTVVGPKGTLSLSLVLHELATNAVKYGALSNDTGRVSISWNISGESSDAELRLAWIETGGPSVNPPVKKGFGSKLIKMGLIGTGDARIDYDPAGLKVGMSASLSELQHTE